MHVARDESADVDIPDASSIDRADVDASIGSLEIIIGILHDDIAHGDVFKITDRLRADLHSIALRADQAICDGNIANGEAGGEAFQADAIISGVDSAVRDDGIARFHEVNAVGIDHFESVNADAMDGDILATADDDGPGGSVLDRDVGEMEASAVEEMEDIERSANCIPIPWPGIHPGDDPLARLPGNESMAGDGNILCVEGINERHAEAAGFDSHSHVGINGELVEKVPGRGIIFKMGTAPKMSAGFKMKPDAALEFKWSDEVIACRYDHGASSSGMRSVDGTLDAYGIVFGMGCGMINGRPEPRRITQPFITEIDEFMSCARLGARGGAEITHIEISGSSH